MGRLVMVCSICGEDVHCSEERNAENTHVAIQCGTWDQLIAEIERKHRLTPDAIEAMLRGFIRTIDGAIDERDAV
jgi:hypothetical protein